MNPKSDPLEAQKDKALEKAAEALGEYFDSVRIFVTDKEESSTIGSGNFFAQYGQISLWLQNVVGQEEVQDDGE
jgi:hypothetical protein